MKPITYVIGNTAHFLKWCRENCISAAQLLNVRHVTDERAALGLMRPREGHTVVTLPSADGATVGKLVERGFRINDKLTNPAAE